MEYTLDNYRSKISQIIKSSKSCDKLKNKPLKSICVDCMILSSTVAAAHSPTLWAGTNAGTIYVYSITLPANDKRDTEAVTAKLGKEIQLKHRAPVISICVMDRNAYPLPEPLDVQNERAKAPDMTGGHQVVICSEEQFKVRYCMPL